MKRLILSFLTVVAVVTIKAQMIAYSVSTNVVGEPGESTVIDLQGVTGKELSGLIIDADGNMEFESVVNAKGFPIGFDFMYNGKKMTHFLIGTDLEIQLSPGESVSTDVHKNSSSWFYANNVHDVVGMAPRNGVYGLEDTQISYWTEGKEGTRALCIEYKAIDFGTSYDAENEYCGAKATVQYRLYEHSSNIEMKVKAFKPVETGNYNFFRIGILGDANDFLQVQTWDGSVVSSRDNYISYKKDSYPIDGTVYTFVAPEPCVKPFYAGSNLELTSTSTQISGKFLAGNGDHYIVLASEDGTLSEKPADQTKYQVGDIIGNAKVIAVVDRNEFYSPNDMKQGTYNVFVFAFNNLCMNGPLYSSDAISAAITMKPAAPTYIGVVETEKNMIRIDAVDSGSQMVVALSEEQEKNINEEYLSTGVFGEPTGIYEVGDMIEGGGKVVYIGNTTNEAFELTGLETGKAYFLRAWSTDGKGGYSSEYLNANTVTAAELPWELDMSTVPVNGMPIGWTGHNHDKWFLNSRDGYFYNTVSTAAESESEINVAWCETHDIYLGNGSNWLYIDIAATEIPLYRADDWSMGDYDKIAIQVTTDGAEYKDVLVLDKNNMPEYTDDDSGEVMHIWKYDIFNNFTVDFSEYAGQKVRVRLYIQRMSKGHVQFKNFKISNCIYGIVGNIPGLDWNNDLIMKQDADNKDIYTVKLENVEISELPAEAYKYKLRTNQSWDGYQLPAEGDYTWMPTETGIYNLEFIADVANHTLNMRIEYPFEVSFDNKGNWTKVYAYAFSYDAVNDKVTEYSGAWPGSKVDASGFFTKSWIYTFSAEEQPQFIIWNNGGGNSEMEEPAEQTDDLPFVNGKRYSYYPEIVSVQLPGDYNAWNAPNMADADDRVWITTIEPKEDTEFKLQVNGDNWVGFSDVTIEAPDGWITEGSKDDNILLRHSVAQKNAYEVLVWWMTPSKDVKRGWYINIAEGTPTGVRSVSNRVSGKKNTVYNLRGQQLDSMRRGVNIVNGQKVLKK